ncbi:MAG: hypothetical protein ACKV0T_07015 [Planctomycetales bacterium]
MIDFRKTLPPVPESLAPLARELEQLYSQMKRSSQDPTISMPPFVAFPGQLPYRMEEGGKMVQIRLRFTPVTDEFLKKLAVLPDLEWLDLLGTSITDVGLENLAGAPALKKLYLSRTQVTQEAAARFRETHPNCEIDLSN